MELNEIDLEGITKIKNTDCLIIIDMQNDFLPGGALPVAEGDVIIPGVNELAKKFHSKDCPIIFTQDWHPPNHESFASVHDGKQPYDSIEGKGIGPILWPDHCVQGSKGAELTPRLNIDFATLILRKGYHKEIDSYSAFLENDKETETGLRAFLSSLGVKRIYLCGLALDYCVFYSAIDGKKFGFDVYFVLDLTRAVNSPENSVSNAFNKMSGAGIKFIKSEAIID
ncbi:MAG: bifunctional nicotinamidase/pyrazinamidase [Candidatus Hodarchaeales archaeon]